jgi:hypothetical protein
VQHLGDGLGAAVAAVSLAGLIAAQRAFHENGKAQLATCPTREEAEHLVVEIQLRGVRATLRAS